MLQLKIFFDFSTFFLPFPIFGLLGDFLYTLQTYFCLPCPGQLIGPFLPFLPVVVDVEDVRQSSFIHLLFTPSIFLLPSIFQIHQLFSPSIFFSFSPSSKILLNNT